MDARRRNRYLEAIGIDVWVPRPGSVRVLPAADAPAAIGSAPRAGARRAPASPEPVSGDLAARWEALRSEVIGCTRCALHTTRS